jgi:ATP-grasp domain
MSKVLLVSCEDWDSLAETPSIFKRGGYASVDVLCSKHSWLISNSYYDRHIEIKKEPGELEKQVVEFSSDKSYDRIVLLDDMIISLMNHYITSDEVAKRILPLTKTENREMLSSKAGFSKTCEKYDILSPKFLLYANGYNIDEIDSNVTYPILLKLDLSWSGAGLRYCANIEELKENLSDIKPKANLLIQEYITGEEIGVEALFHNGQLVTYNSSRILEYFDSQFTYTARRLYSRNKEIASLLETLGESVGLNGFASISYIYDPIQKKYYLIEVDTRMNNWMASSRFTGHDFAEGLRRILKAGNNLVEPDSVKGDYDNKEIEIALFYRDLRRCWKKRDLKGLLRWVFNYKGYWKFIPSYDRKLLNRMFQEFLNDLTKKRT